MKKFTSGKTPTSRIAQKKMGNVAVTSPGMVGKINGWFIHKAVHPVSFGPGSVKKRTGGN